MKKLIVILFLFIFGGMVLSSCSVKKNITKTETQYDSTVKKSALYEDLASDSAVKEYNGYLTDTSEYCTQIIKWQIDYDSVGRVKTKSATQVTRKKKNHITKSDKAIQTEIVKDATIKIEKDTTAIVKSEKVEKQSVDKKTRGWPWWILIVIGVVIAFYMKWRSK